jgi:hypothetical protein
MKKLLYMILSLSFLFLFGAVGYSVTTENVYLKKYEHAEIKDGAVVNGKNSEMNNIVGLKVDVGKSLEFEAFDYSTYIDELVSTKTTNPRFVCDVGKGIDLIVNFNYSKNNKGTKEHSLHLHKVLTLSRLSTSQIRCVIV